MYTGKGTICNVDGQQLAFSTKIVLSLMKELLGKGNRLIVDSCHASTQLADLISQQNNGMVQCV